MFQNKTNIVVRCLSAVAEASTASTAPKNGNEAATKFALFPTPTVVTPPFEASRFLGNTISKLMYLGFEKGYTNEKFSSGAESAIVLTAKCVKDNNFANLRNIMLGPCVEKYRERLSEIPQEVIQQRFNFTKENIIHSRYHSSLISSNKSFNLDVGEMTFFATAIAVIQPNSTKRVSLNTAIAESTPDTLFCNVT